MVLGRAADNVGIAGCTQPDHDLTIGGSEAGCDTGTFSEIDAGDANFTTSSSRHIKENFTRVPNTDILQKIENIPVSTYDFIDGPKDKMGLVAEDFYTVFGRGSDKVINGNEVTMALWLAVQTLTKENQVLKARVEVLEVDAQRMTELESRLAALGQLVQELSKK